LNILGISSLDADATASLVQDERISYSAAEERFSRIKQHAGFPGQAIDYILERSDLRPDEIDVVAYPFYPWHREAALIAKGFFTNNLFNLFQKDSLKSKFFHFAYYARFCQTSLRDHRKYHRELLANLHRLGLEQKLTRVEHHLAHAASAFYTSGLDEALILTLDAYGSELAGSISIGSASGIERVYDIKFPHSLGMFYSQVTEALGFRPTRHEGKIVGLAAYGDASVLFDEIYRRFKCTPAGITYISGLDVQYCRRLAKKYPREQIAAAYQAVLEKVVVDLVASYLKKYGQKNVVLAGGVLANVKLNQRIFEIHGVEDIFVFPNMGDGGTGAGAALHCAATAAGSLKPYQLHDVYLGPSYDDDEIQEALDREGLQYEYLEQVEKEVAVLISQGKVVARFDGAMEYGPRALGNRSVLYHTTDPSVNDWLNQRLERTEFMPFAPATLFEFAEKCYLNLKGAEHAAEFMTVTFDCTDFMKKASPAAVHVDGTARPQLVREEVNPGFYKIIDHYHKLTGIPSIINTSFNMHEEPIVCTPDDAVKAFRQGRLDYLAIGKFLARGVV